MNVYINLPVADLARSRAFFSALGFGFNEQFCDETALGMTISETTHAMLLTREKFQGFTPRAIADATATTEVLTALQLDSREAVDRMVEAACAHGVHDLRPAEDHGFMYGRAFSDPDGHIWEPFWFDTSSLPGDTA